MSRDTASAPNSKRETISLWLFMASMAAYFGSLALPAYQTDYYGQLKTHYGLEALLLGPIGFFAGHFSWIANPLLWVSWAKRHGPDSGLSFVLACLALIAAGLFLVGNKIAEGSAGEFAYHASVGFYVWLGSMAAAAAAAITLGPATSPDIVPRDEA